MDQPNIFTNPVGWLREWAEQNAASAPKDKFGKKDPGWFNNAVSNLTNATDAGTQEYTDALETQDAIREYGKQLETRGIEIPDNLTTTQAVNLIKDFDKKESTQNIIETQSLIHNSPENVRARMVEDRRYYDNQQQMAQQRLDTLAAIERSERREDLRYNERLELEAKRDRRQAMQSLAAGLASLGAAFAL